MTDALAKLDLPGSSITLRRATRDDLPAIVELLVNDPLGRTREAVEQTDGFVPYEAAFAAIDTDLAHLLVVRRVTLCSLDPVHESAESHGSHGR